MVVILYPVNALDSITLLLEIIATNQITQRRSEFSKSLWIITGVTLKLLMGDPDSLRLITPLAFLDQTNQLTKELRELNSEDLAKAHGFIGPAIMSCIELFLNLRNFLKNP